MNKVTRKDKLKIFSLMCSDYFEVGVTLFKQNDLSIEEFIYWALNKSKWTINKDLSNSVFAIDLYILSRSLTITLSWDSRFERLANIVVMHIFQLKTLDIYMVLNTIVIQ